MTDAQFCPISQKWCRCETRCQEEDAIRAYAEHWIRREKQIEGAPEHDQTTRGDPLKAGR